MLCFFRSASTIILSKGNKRPLLAIVICRYQGPLAYSLCGGDIMDTINRGEAWDPNPVRADDSTSLTILADPARVWGRSTRLHRRFISHYPDVIELLVGLVFRSKGKFSILDAPMQFIMQVQFFCTFEVVIVDAFCNNRGPWSVDLGGELWHYGFSETMLLVLCDPCCYPRSWVREGEPRGIW